jgi:hypothetical protein
MEQYMVLAPTTLLLFYFFTATTALVPYQMPNSIGQKGREGRGGERGRRGLLVIFLL